MFAAEEATIFPFPSSPAAATPSYFVVMIDYGRRGCQAVVDPEMTRRDVVACLVSREYDNVRFIHEIEGSTVTDVTLALQLEASAIAEAA